jgi:hypothetical protein
MWLKVVHRSEGRCGLNPVHAEGLSIMTDDIAELERWSGVVIPPFHLVERRSCMHRRPKIVPEHRRTVRVTDRTVHGMPRPEPHTAGVKSVEVLKQTVLCTAPTIMVTGHLSLFLVLLQGQSPRRCAVAPNLNCKWNLPVPRAAINLL